jgi:hypothetical protein
MSAAVSEAPHRYSPLSGDEASCASRKPKCVAKLSFRYRLSTYFVSFAIDSSTT